jgi:hypothetical protein
MCRQHRLKGVIFNLNYKPFTWNHDRFPDPKKMISDLRMQGFRVVTIVDPHPKKEKGCAPYDEGIAGNYFVKNPDVWCMKDRSGLYAPKGTYRPAPRDLILEMWSGQEPKRVSVKIGGEKTVLPQLAVEAMTHSPCGWSFANGLLTIKDNDALKPMQFIIKR